MTDFIPPHVDWFALSPVLVVLVGAVFGVIIETFVPERVRRTVQLVWSLAVLAGSFVLLALLWKDSASDGGVSVLGGAYQADPVALFSQGVILVISLVALLVIADRSVTGEGAFAAQAAAVPGSEYEELARSKGLVQTEVFPLTLFAVGGMLVFVAAGDLLVMFIALEILSLPLYLLTGMARRSRLLSQEASLKYFMLGAYSSAFFLFGAALLFGYANTVSLGGIAQAIGTSTVGEEILLVGVVLLFVGLLFKVGAVPFHSWTPDVYQGAPTPVTGFMAAATKVAAFVALLRVVYVLAPALEWDLRPVMWGVAILTMVVGTVIALVQTDIKRILAYSSIAHAGFVLTGLVALEPAGISSVMFYLLAYGAATVGAFAVVTLVRQVRRGPDGDTVLGEATHVSQWAGLGRTNPVVASAFALFLISFAGIPLTAGFTGKFAVFAAAAQGGATALVIVGVLASAAAAFFYVRIIVLMFFTEAPEPESVGGQSGQSGDAADATEAAGAAPGPSGGAATATRTVAPSTLGVAVVRSEGLTTVAIGLCVAATIALGVVPGPVLDLAARAAMFIP